MKPETPANPPHAAMVLVAQICISETFVEEAESLLSFLQSVSIDERFLGLLSVWIQAQRGDMQEALRNCNQLMEFASDSPEVCALLALLRYVCRDPNWKPVADALVANPDTPPDARRIATSLLDGSFARPKPKEEGVEPAPVEAKVEPAPAKVEMDYQGFMRA